MESSVCGDISCDYYTIRRLVHRPSWAGMQVWLNEVGYPARPDVMSGYRLTPTSFGKWAVTHVAELRAATARRERERRDDVRGPASRLQGRIG